MINIITNQRESVVDFVSKMAPYSSDYWNNPSAIGIEIDGNLAAGVVFPNWNASAGTIEISAAALDPRWLSRRVLNLIMDYVFNQLQCQMVMIKTGEHNDRMRDIAIRVGADEHVIPRGLGIDEDLIIYTLTDDQWAVNPFNRSHK